MFYGQLDLDRDLYEMFFRDKQNGFFVEAGAFDGLTESSCKFFEETMGWTGMNIEPLPYAFNLLKQNRPNCINENYALADHCEDRVFTQIIHPTLQNHFGCGSLEHSEAQKEHFAYCEKEEIVVKCIDFYELYKRNNLPDIDLFVLDIEGLELAVIPTILKLPYHAQPKVFCIEDGHVGLDNIIKVLPGYDFVHKHPINAFFVKK